jgi:uncharacterized protein (DUF2062 family)
MGLFFQFFPFFKVQSHISLGGTVGPFTGGNKVVSDMNTDVNFVSDMVSPLYWFFFYDSGKQISSMTYDMLHRAFH